MEILANEIKSETGNFEKCTIVNVNLSNGANTIASPSGSPFDGQEIIYRLYQPSSGSPGTATWNAIFNFGPYSITLSTANGRFDIVKVMYRSSGPKWDVVGFLPGY
jgi:hypothetical protein